MRLQERAIVAPSARLMLVALLVTLAEEEARGDAAPASGIVAGASLLKRLAQLSLAEVHRLAGAGTLELIVRYDGDQVAWSLQAATRKYTEQALLEYFLRHGAPRAPVPRASRRLSGLLDRGARRRSPRVLAREPGKAARGQASFHAARAQRPRRRRSAPYRRAPSRPQVTHGDRRSTG
jgi:hypothetical protein